MNWFFVCLMWIYWLLKFFFLNCFRVNDNLVLYWERISFSVSEMMLLMKMMMMMVVHAKVWNPQHNTQQKNLERKLQKWKKRKQSQFDIFLSYSARLDILILYTTANQEPNKKKKERNSKLENQKKKTYRKGNLCLTKSN